MKLCPNCGEGVDTSVTGTGTCSACKTVFVNTSEEYTLATYPEQWEEDA